MVDLILHNANVITMDPRRPQAQAVAIAGDRFVAVAGDAEVGALAGHQTLMIDCSGRTLVPGLIDAHCHLLGLVDSLIAVDCRPERAPSIPALQEAIRQRAAVTPPGQWIRASDYNEFYFPERRHPNRWELDAAAPVHPVRLQHRSRHVCVLNSLALALAGINRETPDPLGGVIERDEVTGEPTGVLYEMNGFIGREVVPKLTARELEHGFRLATHAYLRAGVTSVQDATVRNGVPELHLFDQWLENGALGLRTDVMVGADRLSEAKDQGLEPGSRVGQARLGPLKIVVEESAGYLWPPQDDLDVMVCQAHLGGFQVAIHATTQAAAEAAATAIERALILAPRADHRHRIEHCAFCPPPLLHRLQQMRVAITSQPSFLYYSGDRYPAEHSAEKLRWFYRFRSFLDNGLLVAGSTDSPVVPANPFVGIAAAMARRSSSGQYVLGPEESISATEALWMYTMGGAYATFSEAERGSITPGKLADAALLTGDPTELPPEEIAKISSLLTILGGKIVWEANAQILPPDDTARGVSHASS